MLHIIMIIINFSDCVGTAGPLSSLGSGTGQAQLQLTKLPMRVTTRCEVSACLAVAFCLLLTV